ncbi:hypothetical protein G9A89_014110 [Geosiphon pyriformis]|nr:hypothetical protein G9A89_014110 [Geosiphon pyriformis]
MSVIGLMMSILPPHSFGFGISMTCAILHSSGMFAASIQALSNVLSLHLVLGPEFNLNAGWARGFVMRCVAQYMFEFLIYYFSHHTIKDIVWDVLNWLKSVFQTFS